MGKSAQKIKAVQLMDGSRTQSAICGAAGIAKGNLSTFVKQLSEAGLLGDDSKQPKLRISLPPNFFEQGYES